jgi:hypothetical protein
MEGCRFVSLSSHNPGHYFPVELHCVTFDARDATDMAARVSLRWRAIHRDLKTVVLPVHSIF